MQLTWEKRSLEFIKPAKTSRGEYSHKEHYLIHLSDGTKSGIGESAPLPDLSLEGKTDLGPVLDQLKQQLETRENIMEIYESLQAFPSIKFALESAMLTMNHKNFNILVENDFTAGKTGIIINGLVWMDNLEQMRDEALKKIAEGYRCIKFKVGNHDPDAECRLLETVRNAAPDIEIRLDANGAYPFEDAVQILREFARFRIHSVEQPIKTKQWEAMKEISAKSVVPIALDEELIGLSMEDANKLLKATNPAYIVLKPTLLGGFSVSDQWISLAEKTGTGWWSTSALEGNIGLSAIAQWVSQKNITIAQGLGTGSLYKNNFESQTKVHQGKIWFLPLDQ